MEEEKKDIEIQDDIAAQNDEANASELTAKTKKADNDEEAEHQKAIEAIKKFAEEDENSFGEISLKSILGGDILESRFMVNQVMFVIFLVVLAVIYTGNRYSSQQDALTIDSLKVELQEENYKVLTIESNLLNATRQSEIVKKLKANGDSLMLQPLTPPFSLKKAETTNE